MYHLFLLYLLFLPIFCLLHPLTFLSSTTLLLSHEAENSTAFWDPFPNHSTPGTGSLAVVVSPTPGILTQPQLAAGQGNHVASLLQAAPLISHWSKQKSHEDKNPFISLKVITTEGFWWVTNWHPCPTTTNPATTIRCKVPVVEEVYLTPTSKACLLVKSCLYPGGQCHKR